MNIPFANCPCDEIKSGVEEESMMEPKNNNLAGISQTSVRLMGSEEGRRTVHRRPVGLTMSCTKD